MPVTVVHDGPDYTALYLKPGTPLKKRILPDGCPIPRNLPYAERAKLPHIVGDGTWHSNHALMLFREGEAHDVRLFWSENDWKFCGWYVNLQEPVRRTSVGFDTADHVLDIEVRPDLSWVWKDENEFATAIAIGRFSEQEALAIRDEGERVIAEIEAHKWPFDSPFVDWRPDPGWTTPEVPGNWND
jgi:hypothetical protein